MSNMVSRLRERWRDARGITLVLVAGGAVALFSVVALAVDFGMLTAARTEAQRVADLSALAGAGSLAILPGDVGSAQDEAIRFAALNTIRGTPVSLDPADVDVDLANERVTVTVYRTEARGNPMRTWFARVFGVGAVDIAARAVAEAYDAGPDDGVGCLLPIAQQDRWQEGDTGLPPDLDDTYDESEGDWYDPETTGWSEDDVGTTIYIRSATGGGGDIVPPWYFPWTPYGEETQLTDANGPGGDRYRDRFTNCLYGSYEPGDTVLTEPGAMVGPTNQGFAELIDLDPNMAWDDSQGCPIRSTAPGVCVTGDSWRIRPMPLFDPSLPPDLGRKYFEIVSFVNVFVEGKQGNSYYGRIMGVIAAPGGDSGDTGPGNGPIVKTIRLIE